jgi:hypothetical protein
MRYRREGSPPAKPPFNTSQQHKQQQQQHHHILREHTDKTAHRSHQGTQHLTTNNRKQ